MLERETEHTGSWQAKHIFERVGKTYLVKSLLFLQKGKGKQLQEKLEF